MKISIRMSVPVLLVLFLTVSAGYGQSPIEESFARGMDFAIRGKFEEARREFKKVLEIDEFFATGQRRSEIN